LSASTLPIPAIFDPANADVWGYTPNEGALLDLAQDWAKQHGVTPAAKDNRKIHLLVIDAQNDFTHPNGSLYVGGRSGKGAVEDCVRTAELIYRNLPFLTHVTPTLDTHFAYQIFFPGFWVDGDGNHPAPHTIVSAEDVIRGVYAPAPAMATLAGGNYPWLQSYVQHYCEQLEASGKYQLYLWPYHCQLGSVGHTLAGVVEEAAKFHAFARAVQMAPEIKGTSPFTENYSVLSPEVQMAQDGKTSVGQLNTRFLDTLLDADHVVIVGQAASHCVKSSIADLLDQITAKDPDLAQKVYVVRDCMSAVTVPDGKGGFLVDYTDDAEAALKQFSDAGMHVVDSTTPLPDWPDIKV
jgi:nicotinamidase-related amidase